MNRPTKTYELYDVVKVPFPFTDIQAKKIRPALILTATNAIVGSSIMAMITSVKPMQNLWPSDILIADIKQAKLPIPSMIRFKLFTLDHRLIIGHLGSLSEKDQQEVRRGLKKIFAI